MSVGAAQQESATFNLKLQAQTLANSHEQRSDRDLELQPLTDSIDGDVGTSLSLTNKQGGVLPEDMDKRSGILRLTVEVEGSSSSKNAATTRPPPASRWRTPEFMFYGIVFVVVIPLMAWKAMALSREANPNYPRYQHLLSEGWLFGWKIDDSDAQYRSFRSNLPLLCLLALALLGLKHLFLRLSSFRYPSSWKSATREAQIPLTIALSFLFLFILHGANALKILLIMAASYNIAKRCGTSGGMPWGPVLTWAWNMGVLFAIDRSNGFEGVFGSLVPGLEFLDAVDGAYPRWYIPFNFSMLRLVSFNMDYYWALRASNASHQSSPQTQEMDHRARTTTPHSLETYSFANFLSYALYPPLFIAGPVVTFNDYMWQHKLPKSRTVSSWSSIARYAARFVMDLFAMELMLHSMYVVAMKDAHAWAGDTPFELSMIGLWNLYIVWLKLLLPWRFFRLWALVDGIDPPENVVRCMTNNYSANGFWRAWHRSFNLWLIRYVYIPLGGTKNVVISTVLIFTFVALWHDLTFRLLAWGWLVSLFILPEIAAGYLLPSAKYGNRPWYRHVCALGAVVNILMMMVANLAGFVIGVDGMQYMVEQLFGTINGLRFLFVASVCIFVDVQVMFEYRNEEMRHGIYRKY